MKKPRYNFRKRRIVCNTVIRKCLFIASTIAGRNLEIMESNIFTLDVDADTEKKLSFMSKAI